MSTEANINLQEEWKPSKNPWLITAALMLAVFIFAIDGTIANVALPHMAGSFSSSHDESTWVLTSYLIASGIVIPMVDWFSKVFGRKNFLLISIVLFTVASMLCGMANSLFQMVLFRILQGVGGGGIIPIAQAVLLESFPKEKRPAAMSVFSLGVLLAPIIGPVVGGWITDNWTWPWIFYINIPFGIAAIIACHEILEDPPYASKQENVKTDGLGFLFLSTWLITLQIVLDKGNNADWFNSTWVCWTFTVSVIAGILFFISQLTNKDSLIDLKVFRDKNFLNGTIILVIINLILYAALAILPQFLQTMLGYTAFLSGFSMMPRGLGCLVSVLICAAISDYVDNRILVAVGLIFIGLGGLVFGFLNLQISTINILFPNFLYGLGMGFAMIPLITLSNNTLTNAQLTNASGVQNMLKNIGGAVGTSFVATAISRFSQVHQHYLVDNLVETNSVYITKLQALASALTQYAHPTIASYMAQNTLYNQMVQQATLLAYMDAFRIFGILALVVIPLLFFIDGNVPLKKAQKTNNKH